MTLGPSRFEGHAFCAPFSRCRSARDGNRAPASDESGRKPKLCRKKPGCNRPASGHLCNAKMRSNNVENSHQDGGYCNCYEVGNRIELLDSRRWRTPRRGIAIVTFGCPALKAETAPDLVSASTRGSSCASELSRPAQVSGQWPALPACCGPTACWRGFA